MVSTGYQLEDISGIRKKKAGLICKPSADEVYLKRLVNYKCHKRALFTLYKRSVEHAGHLFNKTAGAQLVNFLEWECLSVRSPGSNANNGLLWERSKEKIAMTSSLGFTLEIQRSRETIRREMLMQSKD